jgi:hypothetical protein
MPHEKSQTFKHGKYGGHNLLLLKKKKFKISSSAYYSVAKNTL